MGIKNGILGGLPFFLRQRDVPLGGTAEKTFIDLFSEGTFTRTTEAFQFTGIATGSFVGTNIRRVSDYGDGNGGLLHIEGSRANLISSPRELSDASWSAGDVGTSVVSNSGSGIDGNIFADRIISPSTFGRYFTAGQVGAGRFTYAFYARANPGTFTASVHMAFETAGGAAGSGTVMTVTASTWTRVSASYVTLAATNYYAVPAEGRAVVGMTAADLDYLTDLHQLEAGAFPSSPMSGNSATRGSENFTITPPTDFFNKPFTFSFSPDCNNTELVQHATDVAFMTMIWLGSNNDYIALGRSGANAVVYVYANNVLKITTSTLTWTKNAVITFTVNPGAGTLALSGLASGNGTHTGTAWTWSSTGTLYIGKSSVNSAYAFGRFGQFIRRV